uniref:PCNA-associated factor n=1 Tax=Arion vulgaris TaxID=1028688 RepID=A0A0B7AAJ7_9EUPU
MVRTKADNCASSRKVIAAQAPRKSLGGAGPSTSSADGGSPAGKGKYAGGNPVFQRPTPEWQKGIGSFFAKPSSSSDSSSSSSSSASLSQESLATGSSSSES